MKIILCLTLVLLIQFNKVFSQNDKILKISESPEDKSKCLINIYNSATRRLSEQWTFEKNNQIITPSNFQELINNEKIWAEGKYIIFHPTSRIKTTGFCHNGAKYGEFIEYYPNSRVKHKGKIYENPYKVELTHFYASGSKRREEIRYGGGGASITKYYPNGVLLAEYAYGEGAKHGDYLAYYETGQLRRKTKYKIGKESQSKCYDENGTAIECPPIIIHPTFPEGVKGLEKYIEGINFSCNDFNNDTITFSFSIAIDTKGKASLYSLNTNLCKQTRATIENWVNLLPLFTPASFEATNVSSLLHISFPMHQQKVLLHGNPSIYHDEFPVMDNYDIEEKFHLNYPLLNNKQVYYLVDQMPTFANGVEEIFIFGREHTIYPKEAKKRGISGKVYVQFIVNYEGKIKNIELLRGVHPLLDTEAIKVISLMPDWNPGKLKGSPVNVYQAVVFEFPKNGNKVTLHSSKKPEPVKF